MHFVEHNQGTMNLNFFIFSRTLHCLSIGRAIEATIITTTVEQASSVLNGYEGGNAYHYLRLGAFNAWFSTRFKGLPLPVIHLSFCFLEARQNYACRPSSKNIRRTILSPRGSFLTDVLSGNNVIISTWSEFRYVNYVRHCK